MKKIIIILLILASSLLSGCSKSNTLQKSAEPTTGNIISPEQILGDEEKKVSITEDAPKTIKVFLVIDFGAGEIKELEDELIQLENDELLIKERN